MDVAPPPSPPGHAAPTPAHYEVDACGRRIEARAASAPGARLVRLASLLDVAALAGMWARLLLTADDVPPVVLVLTLAVPTVPLVMLYAACASGMDDLTLRVRRIVGILIPALLIATAAARGRLEALLAASLVVRIPLLTMPFGAFAAHRALALTARAHGRADRARHAARARVRREREALVPARSRSVATRPPRGAGPFAATGAATAASAASASAASTQPQTAFGTLVLASGVALMIAGGIEATHRIWWFGLVGIAAGVLCMVRSREFGAPSSERRLRRIDRGDASVWLFAPFGAVVAVARAIWVLTTRS